MYEFRKYKMLTFLSGMISDMIAGFELYFNMSANCYAEDTVSLSIFISAKNSNLQIGKPI